MTLAGPLLPQSGSPQVSPPWVTALAAAAVSAALVSTPVVCWAASYPGFPLLLGVTAWGLLAVAATLLAAALLALLLPYVRGRHPSRSAVWCTSAAAVALAGTLGAAALDLPIKARWIAGQDAFQRAAAPLLGPGDVASYDTGLPRKIGLYRIYDIEPVTGGIIFYEQTANAVSDDAGFAYLPAGPTQALGDGSWENPQFRHLRGPWWAWTASW